MANKFKVLAICFTLVLVFSFQGLYAQDSPELDSGRVGVNAGDSFTYVVLWNSIFNPNFDRMTTWNQEPGSEFTINIINATPIYEKSWDVTIPDRNYLLAEINFENGTVLEEESLDHFGNWIVFPDWSYWEFVENEAVKAFPSSENNITYKVSSQVTNGPEVFLSRISVNTTGPDIVYGGNYTTYSFTEIHYDKTTGMLLYKGSVYNHIGRDGRQIQYFKLVYVQKEYENFELPPKVVDQEESKVDDSTRNSPISSFLFITSFAAFITTITLFRYIVH